MFYRNGFPQKNEEIKNSIAYIQNHVKKNDKIYVYYNASYAFNYYKNIHFVNIPIPVVIGSMNKEDKKNYIKEITTLKGKNWLLFSHVMRDEETYIVRQLDSLGFSKLKTFKTIGSSTYLYDFKD